MKKLVIFAVVVFGLTVACGQSYAMGKKQSKDDDSDSSTTKSEPSDSSDMHKYFRDYTKDSEKSTTPADRFIPGSTEPVRRDDTNKNDSDKDE